MAEAEAAVSKPAEEALFDMRYPQPVQIELPLVSVILFPHTGHLLFFSFIRFNSLSVLDLYVEGYSDELYEL